MLYSIEQITDTVYFIKWQYVLNRELSGSTKQYTDSMYWTAHWQFCSVLYVLNRTLRAAQCAVQYVTEQFYLLDISAIIMFLTPGGSEINGRSWQKLGTFLNQNFFIEFPLIFLDIWKLLGVEYQFFKFKIIVSSSSGFRYPGRPAPIVPI
jgi:hypothetical protein